MRKYKKRPHTKDIATSVRLPNDLRKALIHQANEFHITLTELVVAKLTFAMKHDLWGDA